MRAASPDFNDRPTKEDISGLGWTVAFISLSIAMGFGIISFIDQHPLVEYKIEQALQYNDNRNSQIAGRETVSDASYDLDQLVALSERPIDRSKTASAGGFVEQHSSRFASGRINHL